jgi:Ca2+-binding EF-hand superfamily protein
MQGCMSAQMDVGYVNWDLNGDHLLNNFEFLKGYRKSHYFLTWTSKGNKLDENQFYTAVFIKLDKNRDDVLTSDEFNSKIDFYYFDKNANFRLWDEDGNKEITSDEFKGCAGKSELLSMWDTSADKNISDWEVARGMFYLCDLNKDGEVGSLEFNIWNVNR